MRSPGRRYFSPGRGRDGKLSPRRRNRTPSLSPETRKKRAQLKGYVLQDIINIFLIPLLLAPP